MKYWLKIPGKKSDMFVTYFGEVEKSKDILISEYLKKCLKWLVKHIWYNNKY